MKSKPRHFLLATLVFSVSFFSVVEPLSAASSGQACKKAGLTSSGKSKGKTIKLKCIKSGKKLVWSVVKTPTSTGTSMTVSQKNATSKAASYLKYSAFSRSGLIEQLEYEGFTNADSIFGTDAQKADWNTQATKKAASYLKTSAFSRSGLITQLEFEGFTNLEAVFGTDAQSADWNVQAGKKAASYLKTQSFSRSGLIEQLLFEGFTQAQAEFGVGTTGL